jgi:hypothetical protein
MNSVMVRPLPLFYPCREINVSPLMLMALCRPVLCCGVCLSIPCTLVYIRSRNLRRARCETALQLIANAYRGAWMLKNRQ